jgi:hypothetical protein
MTIDCVYYSTESCNVVIFLLSLSLSLLSALLQHQRWLSPVLSPSSIPHRCSAAQSCSVEIIQIEEGETSSLRRVSFSNFVPRLCMISLGEHSSSAAAASSCPLSSSSSSSSSTLLCLCVYPRQFNGFFFFICRDHLSILIMPSSGLI